MLCKSVKSALNVIFDVHSCGIWSMQKGRFGLNTSRSRNQKGMNIEIYIQGTITQ